MECFVGKSSGAGKKPEGSVFVHTQPPPSSMWTLVHRLWEHLRVPGAEGVRDHCHPVSRMLGFCFVLDLWLGASPRVQVHNSGEKRLENM